MKTKLFLASIGLFTAWTQVFAQTGVLDQTFGNNGKVWEVMSDAALEPVGMGLQSNGKIIVALSSYNRPDTLFRLNPNGSFDSSFVYRPTGRFYYLKNIAMQPDGKIILNGLATTSDPFRQIMYITRRNADGSVDSSFGINGEVDTTIFSNYLLEIQKVLAIPGGKLLALVSKSDSGRTQFMLFRFNNNGNLDSTFGNNGFVVSDTTTVGERGGFTDMELQPDGKIVVGGIVLGMAGNTYGSKLVAARLLPDGTMDNTFGTNGFVYSAQVQAWGSFEDIEIAPSGKIVLVGEYTHAVGQGCILRLNPNGSYDNSFAPNGMVVTERRNLSHRKCYIQPDEKIVVTGSYYKSTSGTNLSPQFFFLTRYNTNGSLDTSYGRKGIVETEFSRLTGCISKDMSVQSDGKIILAGYSYDLNTSGRKIAIARYEPNPYLLYNTQRFNIYLDRNANGVFDAGDAPFYDAMAAILQNHSDTVFTTSASGYFTADVDTGLVVTTAIPLRPYYYTPYPSRTTNFATPFKTDTFSLGLKPMPNIKDLTLSLVNIGRLRPGFPTTYVITCKNNGTASVSGSLYLSKSSKLLFTSASPSPNGIYGDSLKWNFTNLAPLQKLMVYVYLSMHDSTTVNIGDSIIARSGTSVISGETNVSDNADTCIGRVSNSYDPNDKTESHGGRMKLSKAIAGEYLIYTIRFQNTGNDTAYNVYIRDTLDSKLDWSSMQMITASHNYQLSMNDGRCNWIFAGIMLVDSNKNERLSHGNLVYRIKTRPNVQLGDVIKNKAAIYFDYNLPNITNTETTTLVTDALPLNLLAFTAKRQEKTNLLNWTTANEINVDRFEVERSTSGRSFTRLATVAAINRSGSNSYAFTDESMPGSFSVAYYRLRMIDRDGKFAYSPIRQVNLQPSGFHIALFPNPVKDELRVQMESEKRVRLQMQVVSLDGKVLLTNSVDAAEGTGQSSINVSRLQKGSYLLKTTSDDSEQVLKFEKL